MSVTLTPKRLAPPATVSTRRVLEGSLIADVVVIGGGVMGLSTALRLAEQGKGVVVLEAKTVGDAVGSTPGQVGEALDTRYVDLEASYGRDGTRVIAAAARAAIEQMTRWCHELAVPGFQRVPGFLFSERTDDRDVLEAEVAAAMRAGARASWYPGAPLSFATAGAVRFDDQAQVGVRVYLECLARAAIARNVRICENSRVLAVDDSGPCMVHLENGATVRASAVVFATHSPPSRLLRQVERSHHQSYVTAFSAARVPNALYWDCASPRHRLHMAQMGSSRFLVVRNEDREDRTQQRSDDQFEGLVGYTRARFGDGAEAELHWRSEVLEPIAGLPVIGRSRESDSVYVATGFGGDGFTLATVGAMLISDLIARRPSPFAAIFDGARAKPARSPDLLRDSYRHLQATDFPVQLIRDGAPAPLSSVGEVGRDEGKIVKVRGERLAVYRDGAGCLHAASAVCTHHGGMVEFNGADRRWDCPCHGSRFDVDGVVLEGPATENLALRHVDERWFALAGPSRRGAA